MSHHHSPLPPAHSRFDGHGGHLHPAQAHSPYAPMDDAHHLPSSQHHQRQPRPQYQHMPYPPGPPLPPNTLFTTAGGGGGGGGGHGAAGLMSHRWPIPPAHPMDVRHSAGNRDHKKAKKRTKTGCLTCRKRRIKCDEEKPECRNCQKSKRECLGYEQIKEPRETSPANIQPAPPLGSTVGAQDPLSGTYPHRTLPFGSAGGSESQSAISRGPDAAFERGVASEHDYDSSFSRNMARGANLNALLPQRKVKYIDIEDLFSLDDIPPNFDVREAPPALDPLAQQLVANFYNHHYMSPLDKFFETTWYSANGLASIRRNPILSDFVFQVAQRMRDQVEPTGARYATSLEARLVWKLAIMPRDAANAGLTDSFVEELVPRIDAVEKLFTGQFLDPGRVPLLPLEEEEEIVPLEASSGTDHDSTHQTLTFWHHLCRFASLRDDTPSSSVMQDIESELLTIRNLLGQKETRDILYSIAILRFIGGRTRDFHPQRHIVASTNDAEENTSKLKVAQTFLDREAAHGTDQVTQRMCAMAMRGLGLWRSR